jgi:hypothetical protein
MLLLMVLLNPVDRDADAVMVASFRIDALDNSDCSLS